MLLLGIAALVEGIGRITAAAVVNAAGNRESAGVIDIHESAANAIVHPQSICRVPAHQGKIFTNIRSEKRLIEIGVARRCGGSGEGIPVIGDPAIQLHTHRRPEPGSLASWRKSESSPDAAIGDHRPFFGQPGTIRRPADGLQRLRFESNAAQQ